MAFVSSGEIEIRDLCVIFTRGSLVGSSTRREVTHGTDCRPDHADRRTRPSVRLPAGGCPAARGDAEPQGVALIQSERVNLFEPRQLAVGATILILGIGGNLALKNGLFPFPVPVVFPNGIPAIVFSAIVGILLNLLFLVVNPAWLGVRAREPIPPS
jgi:hypothetical protein